ncbi:MAG: OmpA family protein, partial [Gammaproteobacteria bacterium]|nr:OmpA family protein [Gammaproteobacteria bacterium]
KDAFGVQSEVEVRTIPKGTSVVAQEFSPGVPQPTPLNQVRQFTVDSNKNTLDAVERQQDLLKATEDHARRIREALKEEIGAGSVAVNTEGMKVIIHILEKASFDSGRAEVRRDFVPILDKIAGLIDENSGDVTISGHTDNVPISNERFRSNWELSTSRAVSVAHVLLKTSPISPSRVVLSGHADTRPRADNLTAENRAKNRRVDISIVRGNELDRLVEFSLADPVTDTPIAEETS